MLTKLAIRNFKHFEDAEIELGSPVVFAGPNNSGKTTALQALALWATGLRLWNAKRSGTTAPAKHSGVTVNRRDLAAVPVPGTKALWNALHVRKAGKVGDRRTTSNIRVDIVVEGVANGRAWTCGFEFDYANEESFHCRPLRTHEGKTPERMTVPPEASTVRIAYLPPMSGLATTEPRLDPGAVEVRIGEGRTAEVLRNLCHRVHSPDGGKATTDSKRKWDELANAVERLFAVQLDAPTYVRERGEIIMTYTEQGMQLDLSAAGRGLHQTLLLLAYMHANPGAVLLLDEPDAHLEILRQRQTYDLLVREAAKTGSQIVAATHSEVVLNEAAERDMVIAFVGTPHRVGDRRSQVAKALKEIPFEDYLQAQQKGWVLYLEGPTDLAVLQAFARRLGHDDADRALAQPFVHYLRNNRPTDAARHFQGLKEAVPDLRGVALFDRLASPPNIPPVECLEWRRREIENYLCSRATLEAFARFEATDGSAGPLFAAPPVDDKRVSAMRDAIGEMEAALATLGKDSPWHADAKVSGDFLVPLFQAYYAKLELPNLMAKRNFHCLAEHVPEAEIDPEVTEKLDAIARVAHDT